MITIGLGTILLAGAIAGFTIYLGLPIALVRLSPRVRIFANATSVGILLFLFVEIAYQAIEQIETTLKLSVMGYRSPAELFLLLGIFIAGFSAPLIGLVLFETRFIRDAPHSPRRLALMIAVGIGFIISAKAS